FVLPHRLVPYSPVPGLSLILSPLGNGIVMHLIGRRWNDRPSDRPALFTFGAGFLFGFGVGLGRFVWLRSSRVLIAHRGYPKGFGRLSPPRAAAGSPARVRLCPPIAPASRTRGTWIRVPRRSRDAPDNLVHRAPPV